MAELLGFSRPDQRTESEFATGVLAEREGFEPSVWFAIGLPRDAVSRGDTEEPPENRKAHRSCSLLQPPVVA